jgi:hypothetical protein
MIMSDIPNRVEPEFAALIGIDWGDTKHAWAVQAEGSTQVEQGEMAHTAAIPHRAPGGRAGAIARPVGVRLE